MARAYQLPHKVTRWRQDDEANTDAYGNAPLTAEVFKCRYQEQNKLFPNENGEQERSNAYIYTDSDVLEIGDIVAKGDHKDYVDYQGNVNPISGAFQIKSRRVVTNQRGTRTEYRYIL